MENYKFKKGDKVRVNAKAIVFSIPSGADFLGKKGIVDELNSHPFVKFKNGEKWAFRQNDLELAKPKRHKFDLERALAGEEVVTREGLVATSISCSGHDLNYPVTCNIESCGNLMHTKNGRYYHKTDSESKSEHDLFMLHPAADIVKTDLVEYVGELIKGAVIEPVKDYDRLKGAFDGLLNTYIGRLEIERCTNTTQIAARWVERSGL